MITNAPFSSFSVLESIGAPKRKKKNQRVIRNEMLEMLSLSIVLGKRMNDSV